MENKNNTGTLYICATPIGNLQDTSLRLLDTLKTVDIIISEDTRTTKKLLSKFDIRDVKIESYHDNTTEKKSEDIIKNLEKGLSIAIVSESGMPLISDPGFKLVRSCIEKKINLTVIPGPNAALSALVLSGISLDNFLFIGFLPKTIIKIKKKLEEIKTLPYTIIFYESPNRILALLKTIKEVFGEREICLARELTKIYEECIRGRISEVIEILDKKSLKGLKLKGEIVLVISGFKIKKAEEFDENIIKKELNYFFKKGLTKKEAFKAVMAKYDISRKEIYDISIQLNNFKIN
ncbi:MAG: 16S rRNA (cytidine(1402)-2'-O)-methyltransferase [Actinobacteria bacterium]|nr:16S rRNA (cytidine(1402)-2'-O)-methyltransferase [Actinomycetota bacterium]